MATGSRSQYHEVWSHTDTGSVEKHGAAFGVTFEDACKHLASESVDFWTHFDRGYYQGRRLYASRSEALAAMGPDDTEKGPPMRES